MRPSQLLSALVCTSVASAWSLSDNVADIAGLLRPHDKRSPQVQTLGDTNAASANPTQVFTSAAASSAAAKTTDDNSSGSSAAATSGGSAAATSGGSAAATSGGSSAAATSGGSSTKKASGSNTSKNTKETSKTSSISISPNAAAGGVSMITPNALSTSSYYKIGNYITFGWNYTSLSVTPSAVDILASCSANQATYTLALNQSISASTGAFTWDTGNYQATATQQLLTETYTLIIYDAAKSISATASPGYLGVFDTFTFGMYTPQPYTPLSDWVCATCNGAMSNMEKQTLGFMALMATISVVTFTSFLGGAGLLF